MFRIFCFYNYSLDLLSKSVHRLSPPPLLQVQSLFYLRHSVALILLFVGAKMTLEFFHFARERVGENRQTHRESLHIILFVFAKMALEFSTTFFLSRRECAKGTVRLFRPGGVVLCYTATPHCTARATPQVAATRLSNGAHTKVSTTRLNKNARRCRPSARPPRSSSSSAYFPAAWPRPCRATASRPRLAAAPADQAGARRPPPCDGVRVLRRNCVNRTDMGLGDPMIRISITRTVVFSSRYVCFNVFIGRISGAGTDQEPRAQQPIMAVRPLNSF